MAYGLQDTELNHLGSALKTRWTGAYFALFTAEPNSSGSNEYSGGGYARIAVPGWGTVSSGGDFSPTGLPVEFSGVAGRLSRRDARAGYSASFGANLPLE